jgi:hypothetical protein
MRRLAPFLLAVFVVLAGCNGIALPGSSNGAGTATPATTATPAPTPEPPGENVTAASVAADALAASGNVSTYRVRVDERTNYTDLERTFNATVNGSFDRAAGDAALNRTQESDALTFTVETYLDGANETLYQHSLVYRQQYGSTWVSEDLSGNYSTAYAEYDTLARQRALLNASNLTLNGTTTVDGTDAYVLNGSVAADAVDRLGSGAGGDLSNVTATFYVAVDGADLIRSTVTFDGVGRVDGRVLPFERTVDVRFAGYGDPVDVDVPAAAYDDAVAAGNRTATDG